MGEGCEQRVEQRSRAGSSKPTRRDRAADQNGLLGLAQRFDQLVARDDHERLDSRYVRRAVGEGGATYRAVLQLDRRYRTLASGRLRGVADTLVSSGRPLSCRRADVAKKGFDMRNRPGGERCRGGSCVKGGRRLEA